MTCVIVGAGPAGIRAAQTLVRNGIRPILLDESPTWGGQIYRQQPKGFQRSPKDLYGFEASRAVGVHHAMAEILDKVDYRPSALVWGAESGHLDVLRGGKSERVHFDQLIVATGATDRVLPFPGWTLPGVYTLGGAQVALKFQGCGIGERVVFAGSGPLLYLVAYQYAKAGAKVEAVLDMSRTRAKLAGLARMALQPAVLAKGIYYAAWLRAHGIAVREGARVVKAVGT
jgi:hydrogen cyanide synthase HcnB